MTPEAQHQAIAESVGYYLVYDEEADSCSLRHPIATTLYPWHKIEQFAWEDAPDFLSDLNAIHEAVMSRDSDERWAIFATLAQIVPAELPSACGTAAQWSEAFLRTLDLWTDT